MTAYIDTDALKAEYAPYHTFPEFQWGFDDYNDSQVRRTPLPGVAGQAYDRGAEAAMRIKRASEWIDANVGAN